MILMWMFHNIKKTIAMVTAFGATFGFLVSTVADFKIVQANDKKQDEKIEALMTIGVETKTQYKGIIRSLEVLQDREYQELKQARQQRLTQKP